MQSQTRKRGFLVTYDYNFAGRNIRGNLPDGSTREFTPGDTFGLVDLSTGVGTETNPAPFVRPQLAVTTIKDGNGNEITFGLNGFGAGMVFTDALNRNSNVQRDADSNPIQVTQPNGAVTVNTFDNKGNLLTSTENSNNAVTTMTYDTVFNNITSLTDPENNLTTFNYDSNGNLTEIIDVVGTRTTLEYTDINCPGQPTSQKSAVGLAEETTVTQQYDPATCNLVKTIDHLNFEISQEYDTAGNLIKVTDAKGRVTRMNFDSMGRRTMVIDPRNTEPSPICGTIGVTCFTYDEEGNLKTLMDTNGNITVWEYDNEDRTIKRTDPLLNFETFQYDGQGNLIIFTDRKGQVVEFQYDTANQLKKTHPASR